MGWGDDADKRDLYFCKPVTLPGVSHSARICLAAVNRFTLYINGQEAARGESRGQPRTLDIAPFLQAGRNLLAVQVHTDTPLDSRELTQAETIPPDALASLLLQGEIVTNQGTVTLLSDATWAVASEAPSGWPHAEPAAVQTVDPRQVLCHVAPGLRDADWVWAWERGKPPMLPWGALPLFGELPQYPRPVRYTVTLPAGAASVEPPDVSGTYTARLDGSPVSFAAGAVGLPADDQPHLLQLEVSVSSPDEGLRDAVRVCLRPRPVLPGDWRSYGLGWFSGRAQYQKTVTLRKDHGLRYVLDLGQVCFYAEIRVNGTLCGTRLWPPYRLDITGPLRNGDNEITLIIANAAACERRHMLVDEGLALAWNRYWNEDNIDREPETLVSGLLGPAVITGYAPEA